MITIKIGTAERRDGDIDARWITGQVNARRKEGKKFCVFFKVNCGDVNLNLPSRDCPTAGGGGGGRKPNVKEEFILDEWRKKGFPDQDVNPGMVVSFWEFVKRVCD
jgi:hypothetical protein